MVRVLSDWTVLPLGSLLGQKWPCSHHRGLGDDRDPMLPV